MGGNGGRTLSELDAPSQTVLTAEAWTEDATSYLGNYDGNVMLGCDAYKFAGRVRNAPIGDLVNRLPNTCAGSNARPPSPGHNGKGSNYALADGSAKWMTWGQLRANDFHLLKLRKPAQTTFTP